VAQPIESVWDVWDDLSQLFITRRELFKMGPVEKIMKGRPHHGPITLHHNLSALKFIFHNILWHEAISFTGQITAE
jgi:hypothetical protein